MTCIIVGLFCGDKPYRLLLRSLAFVLIALPVFFKFKNEEIALEYRQLGSVNMVLVSGSKDS